MRCPDCQKFVSLEMQYPEDVTLEIQTDEDGFTINMTCRIVRNCAECGQEMKEATLEAESTVLWTEVEGHSKIDKTQEFVVDEESVDQIEEGGGRYAKSFFGASITYVVNDAEGKPVYSGTIEDKVAASSMDEMV